MLLAVFRVGYCKQPTSLENGDTICVHVLQSRTRKVPGIFWHCVHFIVIIICFNYNTFFLKQCSNFSIKRKFYVNATKKK